MTINRTWCKENMKLDCFQMDRAYKSHWHAHCIFMFLTCLRKKNSASWYPGKSISFRLSHTNQSSWPIANHQASYRNHALFYRGTGNSSSTGSTLSLKSWHDASRIHQDVIALLMFGKTIWQLPGKLWDSGTYNKRLIVWQLMTCVCVASYPPKDAYVYMYVCIYIYTFSFQFSHVHKFANYTWLYNILWTIAWNNSWPRIWQVKLMDPGSSTNSNANAVAIPEDKTSLRIKQSILLNQSLTIPTNQLLQKSPG